MNYYLIGDNNGDVYPPYQPLLMFRELKNLLLIHNKCYAGQHEILKYSIRHLYGLKYH